MGNTHKIPARLVDVMGGNKPSSDIEIMCEVVDGYGDAGVLVHLSGHYRVAIENYKGILTCHVWATQESVGSDPTHSIEIDA